MKKLIILLALGAFSVAGVQSNARADAVNNGYDPLYWNGPSGFGDFNILFTGPEEPGLLMRLLSRQNRAARACSSYSRKYMKTGRRSWLRKYKICLADYN